MDGFLEEATKSNEKCWGVSRKDLSSFEDTVPTENKYMVEVLWSKMSSLLQEFVKFSMNKSQKNFMVTHLHKRESILFERVRI